MDTVPTASLVALAHSHGVATEYWDWHGRHTRVSAESIRTVLDALGVDASTEQAVAAALADVVDAPWRRTLPATVVCREGWTPWVPVHVPDGTGVTLSVELEDGSSRPVAQVDNWVAPRSVDGRDIGQATFELPGDLPLGWHRIVAHLEAPALDPSTAEATLVVTPVRLGLPAVLDKGRATGLMAQLYQVRSARSWGIGDLGDLADLATWAAVDHGAEFVLVNPLHAAEPVPPMEASPYLPSTRRFRNPVYLRVEDVPEVSRLSPEAFQKVRGLAATAASLNMADRIDRDAAWALKREALAVVALAGLGGHRARDFARYCEREGEGLLTFATWCAIAETHGLPWREWPVELQDPHGGAVSAFRTAHAELVDFHRWLQWLLEGQLGQVQRAAAAAGMSIGIVQDLAVGVHPEGADAWGLGDALARGVRVGAPPDQFNQLGQDWSQPPWRPDRLAELGYAPFRDMVRSLLRDSGGIRVDHIIGLFRLWWIPEGGTPAEGTYVRYDHEALIGILALEAHRAGAVVIGEDLGVVEPTARDYLLERGVLGTSILWFEWDGEQPLPPDRYRELCLTSVTTHDLPPTAGYLTLEHVEIRERLGLLTRPAAEERAHEEHAIAAVRDALLDRGLVAPGAGVDGMLEGLHRWLAATPSVMLGYSLADLVGDRRAVNQPGTDTQYPNWVLPLAGPDGRPISLEEAMASQVAGRVTEAARGIHHPA